VRGLFDVTFKDLLLVARDRPALLFLVLVPIVVVGIIAATLGLDGDGKIRLPVVNQDQGPVAEVLLESLRKHVEVVEVDQARAQALVGEENDAAAALILPEGLSKRYLASRPSTLRLITDPVKGYEVGAIKAWLLVADRDAASLADPFFEELLTLEERNVTGSRINIPTYEQSIPGFSLMFVLMGVLFGVAFGLRDELDCGALTRLRVAPIPAWAVLGGKLLARFAVGLAQLWLLFAFGRLVFGMSLGSSLPALFLVTLATVFAMTGFSLVVAAVARSREQIIPLGLTVIMVVCSLGGCWWPLYEMPTWLSNVSYAFLTPWAMEGIHDVILREQGLVDVAPTLGVLTAYGAVSALLGARLYRWEG
jgi:ABC-type multidrug transport system permease subunit